MKKLLSDIEKRLLVSFSKRDDKGKAPFYSLGEFKGNLISVKLFGDSSVLDSGIKAMNFNNGNYHLNAIRKRTKIRVPGEKLFQFTLLCEYKPVKQDEEII